MAKIIKRHSIIKHPNILLTLDVSSTATGFALYDSAQGGLLESGVLKENGDYVRIPRMACALERLLLSEEKFLPIGGGMLEVWVEQPFYVPKMTHDTPIKMAHGALLYALYRLAADRLMFNFVNVSSWRKNFVSVKDSAEQKKKRVMAMAGARFNVDVIDDNHGDALGILAWRLDTLKGE